MKTKLIGIVLAVVMLVSVSYSIVTIVASAQEQEITAEQITPFNGNLLATSCMATITVLEAGTSNVIPGALVNLDHLTTAVTDQNGQCSFYVSLGQHTAYVSKYNVSENQCFSSGSITFTCYSCGNPIYPYPKIEIERCACPATLIINKTVIGGPKDVGDFPLFVSNESVTSGIPCQFLPGSYIISETGAPHYTAVISGDCNETGSITMVAGQSYQCNITNTYVPPPTPKPQPPAVPIDTPVALGCLAGLISVIAIGAIAKNKKK